MGAQGVCIGRPYIWGLGAFGQPGVERVLELLRIELRAIMQQIGAPSIKHLTPAMVRRAPVQAAGCERQGKSRLVIFVSLIRSRLQPRSEIAKRFK